MTTTTSDIAVDLESSRERRLARAMSSLRTRTQGTDAARVLLIIGSIAAPLGLIFIYLGWMGASRTPNLYEQIPYSISGGMLGLGLVFGGGFAYFAYWMTLLVRATQRDTAETRAVLERIEVLLSGGAERVVGRRRPRARADLRRHRQGLAVPPPRLRVRRRPQRRQESRPVEDIAEPLPYL